MKRPVISSLVVCSLVLLGTVLAREMKPTRDQGNQSSKWVDKGNGVSFQLVTDKGESPEVAVLKLSKEAYEDFTKDPAKFMNKQKIFSADVRDPSPAGVSLAAPHDAGASWYLIVPHGHMSRTYSAAVPAPPEN